MRAHTKIRKNAIVPKISVSQKLSKINKSDRKAIIQLAGNLSDRSVMPFSARTYALYKPVILCINVKA
ncbi:hypothetical protein [Brunnivagina elsteri]|uniref:hypothetical protein n=1 Tax=Brunnivagina elsteri TaxID=1247191 RepID=UPI0011780BA5|nr:hypothetical protein [Calothrix elsteri]